MTNRLTRFAAAAAIIIVAVMVVHRGTGSIDGAAVALARMLDTMQEMKWVHTVTESRTPDGPETIESWLCFDPLLFAARGTRVSTSYVNYETNREYLYSPRDPYSNKITIVPITERFADPPPSNVYEMVGKAVTKAIESDAMDTDYQVLDGRKVQIIRATSAGGTAEFYIDTTRNLLVRMDQMITINRPEQTGVSAKAVGTSSSQEPLPEVRSVTQYAYTHSFDYPNQGPADIYELGAPRDAEIVDYCPPGKVGDIVAEVNRRIEAGYGDHIAMVLESIVGSDGGLTPSKITMMRQKGQLQRLDVYSAKDAEGSESLYEAVRDQWPDLSVDQVCRYERDEAAERQRIFDGRDEVHTERQQDGRVRSIRLPHVSPWHFGDCLSTLVWCDPHSFIMNRNSYDIEYQMLTVDGKHEGLLGFRVVRTGKSTEKRTRIDDYWLDPQRDYLIIEHICTEDKTNDYWDSEKRTVTLQMAQTPDGRWYPAHVSYQWEYTDADGAHRQRVDKRIIVESGPSFDENVFEADQSLR